MKILGYNIVTDKELYKKNKQKIKDLEEAHEKEIESLHRYFDKERRDFLERRSMIWDDSNRISKMCDKLKKENRLLKSKKKNVIVNMNWED